MTSSTTPQLSKAVKACATKNVDVPLPKHLQMSPDQIMPHLNTYATTYHNASADELSAWIKSLPMPVIQGVSVVAWHYGMLTLVDVLAKRIASSIRGKSPETIRRVFGIVNDFSPEEEERIKQEANK